MTSPSEAGRRGSGVTVEAGAGRAPTAPRPQTVRAVVRAAGAAEPAGVIGGRRLPPAAVVAVAMSGGVDSAVAAALCVAAGVPTVGLTMRLWATEEVERQEGGCCSVDAVEDARRVAARLGIPHYVLDLAAPFQAAVVTDFLEAYADGRTPNPCIRCNQRIKFAALLRRARAAGATHLATGHYARVRLGAGGRATLHRGVDARKDQSYTLYHCDQATLARVCLPLGGLTKPAVRALAAALELGVAAKPDSQELCFVGGGDHRALLRERLQGRYRPGPVVDEGGAVLGTHEGLPFYTVGQRGGLCLAATRSDQRPLYVLRLDPAHNTVVVGPREQLDRRSVEVTGCVYPDGTAPPGPLRGTVQLRAHARPVPAAWRPPPPGAGRSRWRRWPWRWPWAPRSAPSTAPVGRRCSVPSAW